MKDVAGYIYITYYNISSIYLTLTYNFINVTFSYILYFMYIIHGI